MSVNRVCDMGLGAVHEFTLALDKAGFDADLVQKIVNSRGNKMAKDMYAALVSGEKPASKTAPTEKFNLLVDLGTIVVPEDYDHATWLAKFREKHQGGKKKSFYYYNDNITDANFPNPSRILKPGDKLLVRAFKQIVRGTTTSEERMAFLATQDAVHTGAQGASLVFEQKRDQLPKGYWYASFDEKERLWYAGGSHRVPDMSTYSYGDFHFDLGGLGYVWHGYGAFLCFCDLPAGEAGAE